MKMKQTRKVDRGRNARSITASLLTLALLCAPANAAEKKRTITDQGITDAIERDMLVDKSVPSYKVDVQTIY